MITSRFSSSVEITGERHVEVFQQAITWLADNDHGLLTITALNIAYPDDPDNEDEKVVLTLVYADTRHRPATKNMR